MHTNTFVSFYCLNDSGVRNSGDAPTKPDCRADQATDQTADRVTDRNPGLADRLRHLTPVGVLDSDVPLPSAAMWSVGIRCGRQKPTIRVVYFRIAGLIIVYYSRRSVHVCWAIQRDGAPTF